MGSSPQSGFSRNLRKLDDSDDQQGHCGIPQERLLRATATEAVYPRHRSPQQAPFGSVLGRWALSPSRLGALQRVGFVVDGLAGTLCRCRD